MDAPPFLLLILFANWLIVGTRTLVYSSEITSRCQVVLEPASARTAYPLGSTPPKLKKRLSVFFLHHPLDDELKQFKAVPGNPILFTLIGDAHEFRYRHRSE